MVLAWLQTEEQTACRSRLGTREHGWVASGVSGGGSADNDRQEGRQVTMENTGEPPGGQGELSTVRFPTRPAVSGLGGSWGYVVGEKNDGSWMKLARELEEAF